MLVEYILKTERIWMIKSHENFSFINYETISSHHNSHKTINDKVYQSIKRLKLCKFFNLAIFSKYLNRVLTSCGNPYGSWSCAWCGPNLTCCCFAFHRWTSGCPCSLDCRQDRSSQAGCRTAECSWTAPRGRTAVYLKSTFLIKLFSIDLSN